MNETRKQIDKIKEIIFGFLAPKDYKIFIFGSRATGNFEKYSDYDIGIQGKKKLPTITKVLIEEAFENSNLPFKVDIVDFSLVSKDFRKVALKKTVELKQ